MKRGAGRGIRGTAALALLCLFCVLLAGCARGRSNSTVYYTALPHTPYPEALAEMLPGYTVKSAIPYFFANLERGIATEAFDPQAVSALENGIARHWYPQALATVVIAADRDKTDARVESWSDLPAAGELVGLTDAGNTLHLLLAAIAYGLEGEGFTLSEATRLLASLYADGNLVKLTLDPPVPEPALVICFDHQAAALKKSGRNIEIIVPSEGTFTYQMGLLAHAELPLTGDAGAVLLAAGLRLPGGQCDAALYPPAAAYKNAHPVRDYTHLNTVSQGTISTLRRGVFRTRLYSSADQSEHQYFVMLYIILVLLCTASFVRRAMQKGVRRAALFTGALLLGWVLVRLIKYQLAEAGTLNRMLWYAFYLFQLSLPLVLLWLAWAIDRQDEQVGFPRWLRALAVLNAGLVAFVFTNDWHGLVFRLDKASPDWSKNYEYGAGYYVVLAACVLPLLAALVTLMVKSGRNPRKKGFVFPLAFCVLLFLYGYGYVTRVPLAWNSDFTMVVGLFTLLFIEACFRTRLIPVNSRYTALFAHSPLGMQIFDRAGRPALASQAALPGGGEWLARALAAYPAPVEKDDDTLLYCSPITGGTALWQEDIGGLNRLHRAIEGSVRKLAAANAVLAEEERLRRTLDEERAKAQLMEQLEAEIAGHTARLTGMIAQRQGAGGEGEGMLPVALLLCYIKRRCNLFFRQRESGVLPAGELAVYLDELAEIAAYGEIGVLTTNELDTEMPVGTATLFYSFYHAMLEWAARAQCPHMLVHLGPQADALVMRLLPSAEAQAFAPGPELEGAIAAAGGFWALKDLDGAVGICLSLPKGGVAHG